MYSASDVLSQVRNCSRTPFVRHGFPLKTRFFEPKVRIRVVSWQALGDPQASSHRLENSKSRNLLAFH